VNSAGIVITETTITGFHGFDSNGVPEFVRARKAMQYSASIDDVARIFKEGNNGGYANDWLIADTRRVKLRVWNLAEECDIGAQDGRIFCWLEFSDQPEADGRRDGLSCERPGRERECSAQALEQLMAENKGKIDVKLAEQFLADHVDSLNGKTEPSERTLCGHVELSPRGMGNWQVPFGTAGAVQNKATDTAMAAKMEFTAAAGHACGKDFLAAKHLQQHPSNRGRAGAARYEGVSVDNDCRD